MEKEMIRIIEEPYTYSTKKEKSWKKILRENIPWEYNKPYTGVDLKFHYVLNLHGGQSPDVDNFCYPVFSVLVNEKKYFRGDRKNIQWLKAEKIKGTTGKLELDLSEEIPEMAMNLVIFDEIFQGNYPTSATDEEFAEFVKTQAKNRLQGNDACKIKLEFGSDGINLGSISKVVKPIIDCLYPVLGGVLGSPDDDKVQCILVQKGVRELSQDSFRVVISKFDNV